MHLRQFHTVIIHDNKTRKPLQPFPLFVRNARIAEYPCEQASADVALMGIWQNHTFAIPTHKFMLSARIGPRGFQFTEIANQIATLYRRNWRQLGGCFHMDIDVDSINNGNLIFPGETEK